MKNFFHLISAFLVSASSAELVLVASTTNTWYLSNLGTRTRPADRNESDGNPFYFSLYRSFQLPCPYPADGQPPGEESYLHPCGWRPSSVRTTCATSDPFTSASGKWYTCGDYPELPEGERHSLSYARKLRWRVANVIGSGGVLEDKALPFEKATIEVVQALPLSL
jgi:hypothetical protein